MNGPLRFSARRQAIAKRHRPAVAVPAQPAGRMHGRCEDCGSYHRHPDLRWACPRCGAVVCTERAVATSYGLTCLRCGSQLRAAEGDEQQMATGRAK